MDKQYSWHLICMHPNELDFSIDNIAVTELNGRKICIGLHDNKYFAFAYKCPHAQGIMAYGYVNAKGEAVCPTHQYKFDMATGKNTSGQGYYLKTYPLKVTEDGIFVGELLQ
jgi:nitrite reductase/ring-hydroxylating ferredoxin subunit